jgi:NADP-dependent 3-hydroxy acid dehydrogenase YdfG
MRNNIAEKVVVIADAGNAFGEAIARHLSEEGAFVVLGASDTARLKDLTNELAWNGGRVLACETDITQSPQVARLVAAAVDAFGRVDVLVNNPVLPLHLFSPSELESASADMIAGVHALGAIHGSAAACFHMRRRLSGQIINVGPYAIPGGEAGSLAEKATRRTLSSLSARLRVHAEPYGIRTTFVLPSPQPSPVHMADLMRVKQFQATLENQAASVACAVAFAIGQPAEVACNEILFDQRRIDTAAYETV